MNALDALIPKAVDLGNGTKICYATVNAVNPLVITVDGDDDPLEIAPSSTIYGIVPGDVVICTVQNDELVITGIVDGSINYVEEFIDGIATAQDAAQTAHSTATAAGSTATAAQSAAEAAGSVASAAQSAATAAGDAASTAQSAADSAAAQAAAAQAAAVAAQGSADTAGGTASDAVTKAEAAMAEAQKTPDTLVSSGSTGSIRANGGVLRVVGADGVDQTVLTPGASIFRGDVDSGNTTVTGRLKMTSDANEVAIGGALTLFNKVSAPTNAPTVMPYHDSLTLTGPGGAGITPIGVTRDPANGQWITANVVGTQILVYRHATTGAYMSTIGSPIDVSGGLKTDPTGTPLENQTLYTRRYYQCGYGVAYANGKAWVYREAWTSAKSNMASG